jgi:hypothetical protein
VQSVNTSDNIETGIKESRAYVWEGKHVKINFGLWQMLVGPNRVTFKNFGPCRPSAIPTLHLPQVISSVTIKCPSHAIRLTRSWYAHHAGTYPHSLLGTPQHTTLHAAHFLVSKLCVLKPLGQTITALLNQGGGDKSARTTWRRYEVRTKFLLEILCYSIWCVHYYWLSLYHRHFVHQCSNVAHVTMTSVMGSCKHYINPLYPKSV